jgi:hemoglobin
MTQLKKDIRNRKDIELIVDAFYDKIKVDQTLSHFFEHISYRNWVKHKELMCNFWENILFQKGQYEGNPMQKHKEINEKTPMLSHHFQQWITLFVSTIDEHFEGRVADSAKARAVSVAEVMNNRLNKPDA